jgi:hypothetical protein
MGASMNLAVCVASWGTYWDRFGSEFVASMESSSPRPSEVVIVADQEVVIPEWIKSFRPRSATPMWDWFNEAVAHSESEYVWLLGVDDLLTSHGLIGLKLAGDAINVAGLEHDRVWVGTPQEYSGIIYRHGNPMLGGIILKRDVYLRIPWRRVIWSDWMQWIEINHAGLDVRFDRTPRMVHRRHPGAHSMKVSELGERQINEMKRMLGLVEHGPEWPPVVKQIESSAVDVSDMI